MLVTPVTVEDMMKARDHRAALQRELMERFHQPVVSLTLNIAGPLKRSDWIDWVFEAGKQQLLDQLKIRRIAILETKMIQEPAGNLLLLCVQSSAKDLKRLTCQIEDQAPWSRLLDLDILDEKGQPISREQLGYPIRQCLICDQPAVLCARSRRHSVSDLWSASEARVRKERQHRLSVTIAELAQRALLDEVLVTPKPGLVDSHDSGSHTDMDRFTFAASACALRPSLEQFVLAGMKSSQDSELLEALTLIGCEAEARMRKATQGINTHKGLIYTLSLVCGSLGKLLNQNYDPVPLPQLQAQIVKLGQMKIESFYQRTEDTADHQRSQETAGERQYRRHALTGIHGEAAAGFPSVFGNAWPQYRIKKERWEKNSTALWTLLILISQVEDSNLIARSSVEHAASVRNTVRNQMVCIQTEEALRSLCEKLNEEFIEERLSPGGCADLLALTLFLDSLVSSGLILTPDAEGSF